MFTLIFLWTPPHFWALALYRSSEYEKVGVPMMPWVKGSERTLLEMKVYALLLVGIAAMPWLRNEAVGNEGGLIWTIIAFSLGFWYFQTVLRIDPKEKFDESGRLPTALRSFKASLYYLALLFIGLVITALNTWAAIIFLAILGGNLARTIVRRDNDVGNTITS